MPQSPKPMDVMDGYEIRSTVCIYEDCLFFSGKGFTPGTILANRYRIIGQLGRRRMGEVYRVEDLKPGHRLC